MGGFLKEKWLARANRMMWRTSMEAFYGILIPFLGTSLGAACVFFMKKTLGTDGLLSLSPVTLFNGAGGGIGYGVLLIEVVDGESKTYRYIPVYEVQIAYLKGDTDQYTIEIKCD